MKKLRNGDITAIRVRAKIRTPAHILVSAVYIDNTKCQCRWRQRAIVVTIGDNIIHVTTLEDILAKSNKLGSMHTL